MKYEKIEITEGSEKQIAFAKDLQDKFFDDLEDNIDDKEDIEENVKYYLERLGNKAVNWINAYHIYGIKNYTCNHSTKQDIERKLNVYH